MFWKTWGQIPAPETSIRLQGFEARKLLYWHDTVRPCIAGQCKCNWTVGALRPSPFIWYFFRSAKIVGFALKTAARSGHRTCFPLEILPIKLPTQISAHTGDTLPAVSPVSSDATSLTLGPHSPSQVATEGFLVPAARLLLNFRMLPTLFTAAQILSICAFEKPDPHDDPHCGAVRKKRQERRSEKVP